MAKEHKLPKPASTATDEELTKYAAQFDVAGDRSVLAVEILRLRALIAEKNLDVILANVTYPKTEKPKAAKPSADDDALI